MTIIIGDSYKSDMRLAMKESILGIHVETGRKEVRNDYHLDNIIETKDVASACTWIVRNNCQLFGNTK